MFSKIYSKSNIESVELPGVSSDQLLELTLNTPVHIKTETEKGQSWVYIRAELPYGSYVDGELCPEVEVGALLMHNAFVGDRRLIGTGTGNRLIRSFIQASLELGPNVTEMDTGWARLGCVNALANVVGSGKLQLQAGNDEAEHYGWKTQIPIEQFFTDHPVNRANYQVWGTLSDISALADQPGSHIWR